MTKTYTKNPDIIFRRIADEFVLVPIRQKAVDLRSVFTMNESGAFIWELIDGSNTTSRIRDRFAEEFEVDTRQAESDINSLLSQLESLSFIR